MADKARQWTDKRLAKMEDHISNIYKRAAKGIYKQWDSYMKEADEKVSDFQAAYDEAKKSKDKDLMQETGKELTQRKKEVTLYNDQYKEMLDATTERLAKVNQTALAYVNNQMPSVYTNNFNQIEIDTNNLGIQFGLVDEATVKRLITDGDLSLLQKRLDIPKDQRWNRKQLNSAVLQGILQGESMQDISKRIFPEIMRKTDLTGKTPKEISGIIEKNKNAAIRNARTMVTYAENKGRLDSYEELMKQGVVFTRVWIATPDSRTRNWHLSMDGQEAEWGKPFIDGNGDKLMCPGDPTAPAGTIYNCRCATKVNIIGFRKADGRIAYLDSSLRSSTLHEAQIKKEQERRI